MVGLNASVAWWARTEPARTAIVYGSERIGYGQLQQRVEQGAGVLARQRREWEAFSAMVNRVVGPSPA